MIYEITILCADDEDNIVSSVITVKATTKQEALDKYNKLAVEHSWVGVGSLDNVKEFHADIE